VLNDLAVGDADDADAGQCYFLVGWRNAEALSQVSAVGGVADRYQVALPQSSPPMPTACAVGYEYFVGFANWLSSDPGPTSRRDSGAQ
jgi:hypothetical protein